MFARFDVTKRFWLQLTVSISTLYAQLHCTAGCW